MYVYLAGDPIKGVCADHTMVVNPGGHLGTDKVLAFLCEKNDDGKLVGKTFHVRFVAGKADTESDALGEYLIDHGMALARPWKPPQGMTFGADDQAWRWRA
jgi:hypothetical protein